MVISYKSSLSQDSIEILPAVKVNDEWESKVRYQGKLFMFSTPKCRIVKEANTLVVKKEEFKKFIQHVQDCLIDNITQNSQQIFNGKIFSREKIEKSLEPLYSEDDVGILYLPLVLKDNINCVDPLNNVISYDDISEEITAVVHLQKVVFIKSNFKAVLKISHLKMTKFSEVKDISFETVENDNFFD